MKKITNRELAKIAGVSPTAVSFAINGKKGISEETRNHILGIAQELNHPFAQGMKGVSNDINIAVLFRHDISSIDRLFYSELNNSIMQACNRLPCNLILASAYYENDEVILSDIMYSNQIDGILLYGDISRRILTKLYSLDIPMVALDSSRKNTDILSVYVNYSDAAYTATCHLLELGHRDIAYIGNEQLHEFNISTFSGFQTATTEYDITLATNRIQFNVFDEDTLYQSLDAILSGSTQPTALFCATDYYAIHAIKHLNAKGIFVPNDISVIGIDDIEFSKYFIPSLTTVRIDRELMGRYGFELLQKLIQGEPCEKVRMPPAELIIRDSTAPPSMQT
mgnify:CR=1 FL=1